MKSKLFISVAALGLLIGGLVGCNGNKSSEEQKSSQAPASSEPAKPSSSSVAPSSSSQAPSSSSSSATPSSSSQAPAHEHNYAKVGESVKNADQKDVYVMECADKDDKYIAIAFADYSAIDADFDSAAVASKYKEVDESIWEDAHMLAKTKGTTISWKINLDKAIEGAKLSLGVTSTYASHGSTDMASQFSVKVNDGALAAASITGTYTENGLDPSKRTYLEFATINLAAGENTITLSQDSTSNRLLFGGEVRFHYSGDAKPVEVPVPFEGYNVTFVPTNCKVFVYPGKDYTVDPVETNSTKAKDEEGNIVPYDVEDIELQPQVNFKVVCDEGYVVNKENMVISGAKYKNFKQGPDAKEGLPEANFFRITKIQGDITVTITPVEDTGEEQAPGYEAVFTTIHCSVKVYVGPKSATNTTEDTAEKYYGRGKDSPFDYTKNNGQINFEVIPDAGYKFVSGLEEEAEGKVNFIAGTGEEPYNKVVRGKGDLANCYRITKLASDLDIKVRCIPEAGEAGLGHEVTFVTEHCQVLVYDGQDYQYAPTAPADNKTLSRVKNGDAAKYAAEVAGVDANGDGDYDDEGDTAPVEEVKPQVNFLVVCEEGYEFNSGVEAGKDAKAKDISFVTPTANFNKFENVGNGIYKVTKIQGDITITITATVIAVA